MKKFLSLVFSFVLLSPLAFASEQLVDEEEVKIALSSPAVIGWETPDYPVSGRLAGVEGVVVLEALISDKGKVIGVEVMKSLNPEFDLAAEVALRQWTFRPAMRDGVPTIAFLRVPILFRLSAPEVPMEPWQLVVPTVASR